MPTNTYGDDVKNNKMTKELVDDTSSSSGKAVKITRTQAGTVISGYYYNIDRLPAGQTYTIKFKAKGTGKWDIGQEQGGTFVITPTNEYVEYTKTFTATDDNVYKAMHFYEKSNTNGAYIQFHSIEITSTMPITTKN